MKQQVILGVAFVLALLAASDAAARAPARRQADSDPARKALIDRTNAALLDQIRCRKSPQTARAINAMLKGRLVRYAANESGVYVFRPTAPLTFLGLKIRYIGGFDCCEMFRGAPDSVMAGAAPPVFIEIGVAAPARELRKRALAAGLIEDIPGQDSRRGFQITARGGYAAYLAGKKSAATSSIACVD